jgi:hypothetical protein
MALSSFKVQPSGLRDLRTYQLAKQSTYKALKETQEPYDF